MEAYVLVETGLTVRKVGAAFRELTAEHASVRSVDAVTGPYEFVIRVTAEDLEALSRLIRDGIQQVPGVASTTTCIAWRR